PDLIAPDELPKSRRHIDLRFEAERFEGARWIAARLLNIARTRVLDHRRLMIGIESAEHHQQIADGSFAAGADVLRARTAKARGCPEHIRAGHVMDRNKIARLPSVSKDRHRLALGEALLEDRNDPGIRRTRILARA